MSFAEIFLFGESFWFGAALRGCFCRSFGGDPGWCRLLLCSAGGVRQVSVGDHHSLDLVGCLVWDCSSYFLGSSPSVADVDLCCGVLLCRSSRTSPLCRREFRPHSYAYCCRRFPLRSQVYTYTNAAYSSGRISQAQVPQWYIVPSDYLDLPDIWIYQHVKLAMWMN